MLLNTKIVKMNVVLVDSTDKVIYKGNNGLILLELLNADPRDVTEEDELRFERELRNLSWTGNLRYEVHFNLKFRGVDDWHRPVFKDIDSSYYFGDTNCTKTGRPEDVIEFYKKNIDLLEYFGNKFGCEPHGGKRHYWKLNIID